jgi:hypothetical protein
MRLSKFHRRSLAAGACAGALAMGVAACSDSGGEPGAGPTGAGSAAASSYTTPLTGVCPDPVVVQTGWWPDISEGLLYQLLGPNPTVDADKNRITGRLGGTGVGLEIRTGGPAVGFQPVSAILAQDDDVLLGNVNLDDAIQHSGKEPTVGVFAPYEKSPRVFLWGDPALDFDDVADVGRSGKTVLASESESAYVKVFVREGKLDASKVDTSYQGTPERFVAADGKIVQQGFVTNEPYRLEHDVKAWSKPVEFLLLHKEYPQYQNALSIRRDAVQANGACLDKLVPLFQRAQRDYVTDPDATNQILLRAVEELNTSGYGLSPGLLADGNAKQRKLGLIANGSDGVLGSFDSARVQGMIDRLVPVFADAGAKPKPGLTSADLVTNDFLDKSVSLK